MLFMELLSKTLVRVCLNTESHINGKQFEQKCHLSAQLRIDLWEVGNIGMTKEPLGVVFEQGA